MLYAILKTLHLLAIIVWIGGMVFAHFFLRPSLGPFEPAVRVRLMHAVLGRFFSAVLAAVAVTLVTGLWMIGRVAKQVVQAGAQFNMPLEWTVMATLGIVMMLIFGHIRFVLFKRLGRAVQAWTGRPGRRADANPHLGGGQPGLGRADRAGDPDRRAALKRLMNPDAQHLWRGPRWALAVLLATLGMLGPFSIDTYIPAFAGIANSLGATPVQMQQTLSAYLFGFAFMSLFHGALSDSVGRRPVVLWGLAAFTLASMGCALSQSIGQLVFFRAVQGLTTGAGIVVSRAVVRDMFPPAQAQKVMSQITIYFGVAPAIAPMIGGVLFAHWAGTACSGF